MSSMPKVASEWQRFEQFSAAALYELLRFRQQIFVVEQRSPYADLDGLDHRAWHLLLREGGELAGCLRLVPPPSLRIGRVAVAPRRRGQGLGRGMMEQALGFCRERFAEQPIVLTAQFHLVRFYQGFGFVTTSEPYDDFGLTHVDMRNPRALKQAIVPVDLTESAQHCGGASRRRAALVSLAWRFAATKIEPSTWV